MQNINGLMLFFGIIFVVIGFQSSKEAIKKTINRHQGKRLAFLPAELEGGSISRFFDLAFVLFCCALFSLLLIDAFVIQQETTYSFAVFVNTFLITIVTTFFLLAAWYIGKAKLGIGVAAIFTLAVIPINPNGRPLFWLPILVLVFLATTMWIYEFGFPFEKSSSIKQKIKWQITLRTISIIVFFTIAISTFKLGHQVIFNTLQSDKTPAIFFVGNQKINQKYKYFFENQFKRYKNDDNQYIPRNINNL